MTARERALLLRHDAEAVVEAMEEHFRVWGYGGTSNYTPEDREVLIKALVRLLRDVRKL